MARPESFDRYQKLRREADYPEMFDAKLLGVLSVDCPDAAWNSALDAVERYAQEDRARKEQVRA